MNIDIFLTKSELYFEKITPVITALFEICPVDVDFFEIYVLPALHSIFKFDKNKYKFEDFITDE